MPGLFDTRFIINTGKGGVGKTTISTAMAAAFARRGRRVLLMQLNARDRVGDIFGTDVVGAKTVRVAPNIWAVNTTPPDAMREYALMVLPMRALYRAVFENRVVEKFLRVVPGLPELTMLGKAYYHESERTDTGRPVWDVVIIDAPATGHGMFLLQIPGVISSAIAGGRMAEEASRMLDLLRDPNRTMVNIVTLPEEMPINETLELHARLTKEVGVRVGYAIANAVLPVSFRAAEAETIRALVNTHGQSDDLGRLLHTGAFRDQRCRMQRGHLERLARELTIPTLEVPFYFQPKLDRGAIERIATHLSESADRAGAAA